MISGSKEEKIGLEWSNPMLLFLTVKICLPTEIALVSQDIP